MANITLDEATRAAFRAAAADTSVSHDTERHLALATYAYQGFIPDDAASDLDHFVGQWTAFGKHPAFTEAWQAFRRTSPAAVALQDVNPLGASTIPPNDEAILALVRSLDAQGYLSPVDIDLDDRRDFLFTLALAYCAEQAGDEALAAEISGRTKPAQHEMGALGIVGQVIDDFLVTPLYGRNPNSGGTSRYWRPFQGPGAPQTDKPHQGFDYVTGDCEDLQAVFSQGLDTEELLSWFIGVTIPDRSPDLGALSKYFTALVKLEGFVNLQALLDGAVTPPAKALALAVYLKQGLNKGQPVTTSLPSFVPPQVKPKADTPRVRQTFAPGAAPVAPTVSGIEGTGGGPKAHLSSSNSAYAGRNLGTQAATAALPKAVTRTLITPLGQKAHFIPWAPASGVLGRSPVARILGAGKGPKFC